jgi:uncharacterized protein YjiS (DUF1127 family)
METTMRAHAFALPHVPGFRLRLIFAGVNGWLKRVAQARRHRRQAAALASVDGRMLADIGLSRADVERDAFSEPFWEDPTALLRERAMERRWNRALARDEAFKRMRTDRPARESV